MPMAATAFGGEAEPSSPAAILCRYDPELLAVMLSE